MKNKIVNEVNFNLIGKNKILLIGDTIIDKYVSTEFQKIDLTQRLLNFEENLYFGGASNVALNLYLAEPNFNFVTMLVIVIIQILLEKLFEFLDKKKILYSKKKLTKL